MRKRSVGLSYEHDSEGEWESEPEGEELDSGDEADDGEEVGSAGGSDDESAAPAEPSDGTIDLNASPSRVKPPANPTRLKGAKRAQLAYAPTIILNFGGTP
ncbi:hypothetical protein T492DRAFT_856350 [Pavlovales sp. CCMP2436]|nr:hypothetical protein T492DRAFT_856350 [Pavlovales sp. CCMP2436]